MNMLDFQGEILVNGYDNIMYEKQIKQTVGIVVDYPFFPNGENSVLFSTHISTDLEKIADYVTVLSNGKLFYTGEKDILMEKYAIIKGDYKNVSSGLEKDLIGVRRYGDSFEAMILSEKYALSDEHLFQVENAKIDDILIYAERSA